MSDKPWNAEVERIRKAMMERFSDKLSMEEIAEFAYSIAVECTAPAPQPADLERDLYALLRGICEDVIDWIGNLSYEGRQTAKDVLDDPLTKEIRWKLHQMYQHPLDDKLLIRTDQLAVIMAAATPQELELEQEADGRWLAEFMRFPGVAAYGPSKEEAIRNAAKVLIESEQASQITPQHTYSEIDLRRMRRYAEELRPYLNKEYPDPPRGLLGSIVGMLERSIEGASEPASPIAGLLGGSLSEYSDPPLEPASPREFKPYMEDHEYYDSEQASPTPEKSRSTGISLDGGKTIHSKFEND